VALPKVFNWAKALEGASDPLKVLRNYVAEAFPGRSLKVETWGRALSYFDSGTETIYLSSQVLKSSGTQLASTFLHEATHAGQFYAGGLPNALRALSAWVMPAGVNFLSAGGLLRTLGYTVIPAEHLAGAGGGLLFDNALGLAPRAYEWAFSASHDRGYYNNFLYRYLQPSG
jgi:hypothetical protein